jgi:hypothetical protein
MKNLGYDIEWTRDPHYNNTIALYPYSDVTTLDDVWVTQQ